jgi:hypothetical protein
MKSIQGKMSEAFYAIRFPVQARPIIPLLSVSGIFNDQEKIAVSDGFPKPAWLQSILWSL